MTVTIGDLVSVDEQAEFRNDVQLSHFNDKILNLKLLRSYLFSKSAPEDHQKSISPVGVLDMLLQAYLNERVENRFALIANYGHGKSHLALALTNYFSKPTKSEELEIIFSKLSNAEENMPIAKYRDFKNSKGEFLVIHLRGDVPRSLREQFVNSVELALKNHFETIDVKTEFWFSPAEKYLLGLSDEQIGVATRFLVQESMDLPLLISMVKDHRESVYDICVRLVEAVSGITPNFQGKVGFSETIDWLVKTFCGEGNPFGGILVMIDEFSLYIQNYAANGAIGELQDLLNGIESHRGKTAFIAFAQHDPITIARSVQSGHMLQSLEHELTRIPEGKRYFLYSLLESVIDAYLRQSERHWADFLSLPEVGEIFNESTDLTHMLFFRRYSSTLRWSFEKFQETVSKGCYPLHPLTTALISNIEFQHATSAGVPRNVLGFVLTQFDDMKEEPCVKNGTLNWVLPTTLVDYFGERFPRDKFSLYTNARFAAGSDATIEELNVLKALLLQNVAELSMKKDIQLKFIAQSVGLNEIDSLQILIKLNKNNCISQNLINGQYSFWTSPVNPHLLEKLITKYSDENPFSLEAIYESVGDLLTNIPVRIDWGNQIDWAAQQHILTSELFNENSIKKLISLFRVDQRHSVLEEGKRGIVIWIAGRNEGELKNVRDNAIQILDKSIEVESPIPIVLVFPNNPVPELFDCIQRYRALQKFSQDERIQVSNEIYNNEVANIKEQTIDAMKLLRGEPVTFLTIKRPLSLIIAPTFCHAEIQRKFVHLGQINIQEAIEASYQIAYRYNPGKFFTHYKYSTTNLSNAVKLVSGNLFGNRLKQNDPSILNNGIARDICDQFLYVDWRIISSEWKIIEPMAQGIKKGWELLDQEFSPSRNQQPNIVLVDSAIQKLLNSPYGYDYNTLTLLFSAWFGYNASNLQVYIRGQVSDSSSLVRALENGPKKFINKLIEAKYLLERKNPGEKAENVKSIIRKFNSDDNFSEDEALKAISELHEFIEIQNENPADIENATNISSALYKELENARTYNYESNGIEKIIQKESDINRLLVLPKKIQALNYSGKVVRSASSPANLKSQLTNQLIMRVQTHCNNYTGLYNLNSLELNRRELSNLKEALTKSGFPNLLLYVEKAKEKLNNKAIELTNLQKEGPVRAQIDQMEVNAPLYRLISFRSQLTKLTGLSEVLLQLKNKKLEVIDQRIEKIESDAKELQNNVDLITDVNILKIWRDKYLRIVESLINSEYQGPLEIIKIKVEKLLILFEKIEIKFSSIIINNPQDAEDLSLILTQLIQDNLSILSDHQIVFLRQKQQKIEQISSTKINQSIEWLSSIEVELSTDPISLELIRDRLSQIPAFIPNESKPRLEKIKKEFQMIVDKDVLFRIEHEFKQISEPSKRQECISRLQQIEKEFIDAHE